MALFKNAVVINDAGGYFRPLQHTNLIYSRNARLLWENPEQVGVVVFTGGEDVSPKVYGHERHPATSSSWERDEVELEIAHKAISLGIPLFGICRGAQFICTLAGGTLIQDLNNHAGVEHTLAYVDPDGVERISDGFVTSSHHQMQYPYNLPESEYSVVAWTPKPLATRYGIGAKTYAPNELGDQRIRNEPDCVLYHKIKALAIQYHPEWMDKETWGFRFATLLVDKYLMKWVGSPLLPYKSPFSGKKAEPLVRIPGPIVDEEGWD